jgi:hypothetical protein
MAAQPEDPRTRIHGWGADLDLRNRPAVPKEAPSDVHTLRGKLPPRQIPTVKIHQSIEHDELPPVFGTSCPPRGLSGVLRDVAYRYSEGRLAHWMTLMLADRVDVYESLLTDLTRGKVPHPMKERGWKTRVTHKTADRLNRQRNKIVAVGAVVALAGVAAYVISRMGDDD